MVADKIDSKYIVTNKASTIKFEGTGTDGNVVVQNVKEGLYTEKIDIVYRIKK